MIAAESSLNLPTAMHDTVAANTPSAEAPKKHGFSFGDFLDIINPLQHIPVIGTLYRALTGDKIDTPERLVGDTLYGGPWGFASSLADTAFEKVTGRNFGDTVLALVTGKHDDKPAVQVAQVAQAAPAPATDTAQRALFAYRQAMHREHPSAFGIY